MDFCGLPRNKTYHIWRRKYLCRIKKIKRKHGEKLAKVYWPFAHKPRDMATYVDGENMTDRWFIKKTVGHYVIFSNSWVKFAHLQQVSLGRVERICQRIKSKCLKEWESDTETDREWESANESDTESDSESDTESDGEWKPTKYQMKRMEQERFKRIKSRLKKGKQKIVK